MKLAGQALRAALARPDAARPGVLFYGADPMRVALKRQDYLAALLGPEAEAEMRLVRLDGAGLRREPAQVQDALKATGFFPGPRAVLVEEAGDGVAPILRDALAAWAPGDAALVVTAGALAARSALRTTFEKHPAALAAPIYDDPPGRDEIQAELERAGLVQIDRAALGELEALAQALEPGDFRQTLEKIALYKLGDPAPLDAEEVLALAPATLEAEADDLVFAVAEGQVARIPGLMARLEGQGLAPVGLILAAERHFRLLHMAACHGEGPETGLAQARPPVLWKHRTRMARQAATWGRDRLEVALGLLLDTDLALRSGGQTAPQMALVSRLFVRLATLPASR